MSKYVLSIQFCCCEELYLLSLYQIYKTQGPTRVSGLFTIYLHRFYFSCAGIMQNRQRNLCVKAIFFSRALHKHINGYFNRKSSTDKPRFKEFHFCQIDLLSRTLTSLAQNCNTTQFEASANWPSLACLKKNYKEFIFGIETWVKKKKALFNQKVLETTSRLYCK